MSQQLNEFIAILGDESLVPSPDMIEGLASEYPFFALPSAVMLRRCGNALESATAERLRQRVALNATDPDMLYRLTTDQGAALSNFYPELPDTTPRTNDAIDTFLGRYGGSQKEQDDEIRLIERLIFNPVPDYASQLARDEAARAEDNNPDDSQTDDSAESLSSLLDSINGTDGDTGDRPAEESSTTQPAATPATDLSPASDTTFSESLAKIYIKQRRYDKALEIISNLSLKFPEKSVYFADQMRFLQKLIINRNYNSKK